MHTGICAFEPKFALTLCANKAYLVDFEIAEIQIDSFSTLFIMKLQKFKLILSKPFSVQMPHVRGTQRLTSWDSD